MIKNVARKIIASEMFGFATVVLVIVILGYSQMVSAKIQIDHTFLPILGAVRNGPASILVLPDGKLLAFRHSNSIVTYYPPLNVTRFNQDGSVDRIFDIVVDREERALMLQPDGKFVVGSVNILVGGVNRGNLLRFNPDGTLDNSFNADWVLGAGVGKGFVQPDGKIITLVSLSVQGQTQSKIVRINPDGSRDETFALAELGNPLALQPDGKILVGTWRDQGLNFRRLSANGTVDPGFIPNTQSSSYKVIAAVVQSSGKIVVSGDSGSGVFRLNSDGTFDNSFAAYPAYGGYRAFALLRQPDDKILIGGTAAYYGGSIKKRLTRINADGTPDTGFDAMTSEASGFDTLLPLAFRPNGTILASGDLTQGTVSRLGLVSLTNSGAIDQSFSSNDWGRFPGTVNRIANYPGGKIMVAGTFVEANGFPSPTLARLNADGTTDTSFRFTEQIVKIDEGINYDLLQFAIAVQPDGKVLISGKFRYNGRNDYGVFRVNQDGSLDVTFTPQTIAPVTSSVTSLALQPDGKILVGGGFQNFGNSGRRYFVRLLANGSVDDSYAVTSTSNSGGLGMIALPGGKTLVVGAGLTENGNTRHNARLNADGSLDLSFNVPAEAGSVVAVAPDGKLASVSWVTNGQSTVPKIWRLTADGAVDPSFSPTIIYTNFYNGLIFLPNGKLLFSGDGVHILGLNGGIEARLSNLYLSGQLVIPPDGKLLAASLLSFSDGSFRKFGRFLLNSVDFDFDGDGKADIAIFRPSVGEWYISRSSDGASLGTQFGLQGDLIAPADFDGDGRTDISVFRPSSGGWYHLNSSNSTFSALQFGLNGDVPVPADFDGDGKADIAVYRPSAGSWYRIYSSNNQFVATQFGTAEDKPIVGDMNGDGWSDLCVFRPSNGYWYHLTTFTNNFGARQFGTAEDKPVAADYDGDGKTDLAVYRPSNGYWYVNNSRNNQFVATQFGIAEDKPATADYDGDGKADPGVFRPSQGIWYLLRSADGFTGVQYGTNGDIPAPNAFVR